jgi:hypothetical protein
MANKGYILSVVIGITILAFFSCREKVTEPHTQSIQLSVEDVGVTEVWLHLQAAPYAEPTVFTLLRDNQPIFSTLQTKLDTLLLDDSLFPNHTYHYTISGVMNFHVLESMSISVHTMDTTSHNFTWEIDTLGDGSSSVLYDVAIINDTLAIAVGEISIKDSLGNWINPPFNLAKWDGKKWRLSRVLYLGGYAPIKFIFASSENDVWFGMGYLVRWDGSRYNSIEVPPFYGVGSNKMWRSSNGELYVVGNNGTIAFSSNNGSSWRKIESGTTLDIQDIWGAQKKTGGWEILAVASKPFVNFEKKILAISSTTVTAISDTGIPEPLSTVSFFPGHGYYVSGSGIYEKRRLSDRLWANHPLDITHYYIYKMRANDVNDIAAAGGVGEVLHFNGLTWKSFFLNTRLGYGNYYSIAIRGDLIVAVGEDYPRAVVALGRRMGRR